MSGKLFAFNVSKKVEKVDEKARDQWVGDRTARANAPGTCTGNGYGLEWCYTGQYGCVVFGPMGYYVCDN